MAEIKFIREMSTELGVSIEEMLQAYAEFINDLN